MTTISYKNIDYKVICIDPTIETAGDGLTAATALKDFPAKLENNTCYLIRRTSDAATQHCTVNYQSDNTLANFMFLGMPKATDKKWIQDLIRDEEINTTWKNDIAEYANVKFPHYGNKNSGASNAIIVSSKLGYCSFINTYCFRAEKTSYNSSSSYTNVVSSLISNNGITSDLTNILFQGCKFGVLGYDIDKDEFLAENSVNSFNTNDKEAAYSKYGCSYFTMARLNSFVCEDCIINYSTSYDGSYNGNGYNNGKAFSSDWCNSVYMNNVTVNTVANTGAPAFLFKDIFITGTYSNITYNQILTTTRLTPLLYTYGYRRYGVITINDIDIKFKKFGLENPRAEALSSGRVYGGLIIGYIDNDTGEGYGKELYINNLNVDGMTGSTKLAEGNFLYATMLGDAQGSPQASKIRNVTVKLHDEPEECFLTKNNGTAHGVVDIHGRWGTSSSGSISFSDYAANKAAITKIENLYVRAKAAGHVSLRNVVANIDLLETILRLHISSQIQVNKLIYDKVDRPAVEIVGGNVYLRIKDLQVVENKSTDTPIISGLYAGYSNSIYIDKCNQEELFDLVCDKETSVEYINSIAICANAGAEGKFIARNRNVTAQSWSVTRNGSDSAASLRLANNTTAEAKRLKICPNPYKGFTVTPTKTGLQNLVIYFAYRDFVKSQEEVGRNAFKMIVNVPTLVNGEVIYLPQCDTSDWYDDTSVWTDPEAVAKKFVIPVDVKTLDPIEIKPYYYWYHTSGCVYVDPDMRLVPCE